MRRSIGYIARSRRRNIICTAITYSVMRWDFNAQMEGNDSSLSLKEFQKRRENVIDKYYLRDYDMKDVEYAGLKAMVASLGDPIQRLLYP